MPLPFIQIMRDFITDGVPSSGKWKPKKSELRSWGAWVESILNSIGVNSGTIYSTRALLYADLSRAANTLAWVNQDPTVAYNGIYQKAGGVGTGSWSRVGDLPYSFITATDAGAGTPNAIQATTSIPVSASALVLMNIYEANTATPVTVSFNGEAAIAINTNSGGDIAPGGLVAGMLVAGVLMGGVFRLITDQVSSAIVAQVEALRDQMQAIADSAALGIVPDASVTPSKISGWNAYPQGRLTLTASTPAPESDVAAATAVYYCRSSGKYVPIYDGTRMLAKSIPVGLSMALSANAAHAGYHQSGKNFDVFAYDAGSGLVGIGSGPAWTSNVARGTGAGTTELEELEGLLVNKNSITLRFGGASGNTLVVAAQRATYLGSFRTTADGVATNTKSSRLLFNAYNSIKTSMLKTVATGYSSNTAAWVALGNSALNRVEFLMGLTGSAVSARASSVVNNSTSTRRLVQMRIALDSLTVPSVDSFSGNFSVDTSVSTVISAYEGYPGLGYHYLLPITYGGGADSQTWYGADAGSVAGISGETFL